MTVESTLNGVETNESPERFGTAYAWARELGISITSIRKRLGDLEGITAKAPGGAVIEKGFYSEQVIRQRCADLLEDLPEADEWGFIYEEGDERVKYGTIRAWCRELGVTERIADKLGTAPSIKGKLPGGQIHQFYAEAVVRDLCSRHLEDVPTADESGFIMSTWEGRQERFGSIYGWSRELGLSKTTAQRKLSPLKGIKARDSQGQIREFLPESLVREACSDQMENLPQANKDGFFSVVTQDGEERHGHITGWSVALGISPTPLKARLEFSYGIDGKDHKGHKLERSFFSESYVRQVCADLIRPMPQADATGFFIQDGERYGSIGAWQRELHIRRNKIERRLGNTQGITGKNGMGNVLENGFFSESHIREICRDVITQNVPTAKYDESNSLPKQDNGNA